MNRLRHASQPDEAIRRARLAKNSLRLQQMRTLPQVIRTPLATARSCALAPVPLAYRENPARAIHYAAESSRTTHGAPAAVDACINSIRR